MSESENNDAAVCSADAPCPWCGAPGMDTVDSLCTFCSENFESAADCAAYYRAALEPLYHAHLAVERGTKVSETEWACLAKQAARQFAKAKGVQDGR